MILQSKRKARLWQIFRALRVLTTTAASVPLSLDGVTRTPVTPSSGKIVTASVPGTCSYRIRIREVYSVVTL